MHTAVWIRSQDDLVNHVAKWLEQDFVALDTEFERTSTYYANPGLIQLADSEQVYLIDPLEVPDLTPLAPLLESDSTVKVLHSMSEDVELLHKATGVAPKTVFDTQIAANFLGLGQSLGYQKLVEELLGHVLDKAETRSDWLQRPLSDSQIEYAIKDTAYLRDLYFELLTRLKQAGWLEACRQECDFLIAQSVEAWEAPERAYLRLRGAWHLSLDQQKRLQDLVMWRDQLAVTRNVPKSWVFADAILIAVLERDFEHPKDLYRIKGVRGKSVRQYGDELIERLGYSPEEVEADFERVQGPLRGKEMELYKKLKKCVAEIARELGLEPQLLAGRKPLEQLVALCLRTGSREFPAFFEGWRAQYLKAPLCEVLSER